MDQAVTLGAEIGAELSTARLAAVDNRRPERVEGLSAHA